MKIIVVDDEQLAVNYMLSLLKKINKNFQVKGFVDLDEANTYMKVTQADIAFLDIEMTACNGVEIAKQFTELNPTINIIFVTGYSEYMMDAFKLHASGYLMKPVREIDLRKELENLRYPIRNKKRVYIQTFGSFEIFVDAQLLVFPRKKCLECLAYLVDRKGARVTTSELAAILWEDRPYDEKLKNNVHRVVSDLMKVLKSKNIEDIIIRGKQEIAINAKEVDCDYYELLEGNGLKVHIYPKEYMSNYAWAISPFFEQEE